MFWKKRKKAPAGEPDVAGDVQAPAHGPLRVVKDAPRPATILKVAEDLERRGGKVIELFREVQAPGGRAVLPIHFTPGSSGRTSEVFVEVETGPWDAGKTRGVIEKAAVLRASEYAAADLELLSAYPAPDEVSFFFSPEPAALLQLELFYCGIEAPEVSAEAFAGAVGRKRGVNPDYSPESLPAVEESVLANLEDARSRYAGSGEVPVLDGLVNGFGCYVGEVILRHSHRRAAWGAAEGWATGRVLETSALAADPVGKARAVLSSAGVVGDRISYYAGYVLSELEKPCEPGRARGITARRG